MFLQRATKIMNPLGIALGAIILAFFILASCLLCFNPSRDPNPNPLTNDIGTPAGSPQSTNPGSNPG